MQGPFDIPGDLDTPVSAYLKLGELKPCFLLESVEGGNRLGRYSFIGFGVTRELRLSEEGLRSSGRLAPRPTAPAELLGSLRAALQAAPQPTAPGVQVPLAGGLVGYGAYDLVRFFERLPARRSAPRFPECHFVAPQSLLVFDHVTRAIALLHAGSEEERQRLRAEVMAALRSSPPARAWSAGRYAPAEPSMSRAQFLDGVERVQRHIAAGDVYQLVLSVQFAGRHQLDPFQVYRALRLINPSPYLFYCQLGEVTVIGSSPEALVKLEAGQAELRPIAGTRPRSGAADEDAQRERDLLADPKEAAEHVMLVDLARNDLGRVARAGSVRVDPYRAVEHYSHVMHLVSGVHGTLADGRDAFDLFAAVFPAGTLVGAPKVRAMQIIDEL
ncbi:MAG: anthranilate synthase component I family protein, partial [Steroidobacteraceae bacterium]|nr:anthranilate synthase component I family protein [Steroidobacteraceae bacterium]MDW8259646.1 anthranilate synthase component I family protein [Gammaproteobacteria bacterium]